MELDQALLAKRLKEARINCRLTQQQVAEALGLPRTAIVQIEAGKRSVSTLELTQFARLYRVPVSRLLEHGEDEDILVTLFRAARDLQCRGNVRREIARYIEICREGTQLKQLLGLADATRPPAYDLPNPKNVVDAVEQGWHVAEEERRRLGLGHHPISDMAELVGNEGIWACGAKLPDQVSGVFLSHPSVGMAILVNLDHTRARKRFSYAHEYAHAILDRSRSVTVTTDRTRSELHEVRANAFAASFLLPTAGIREFLGMRRKGGPRQGEVSVYDPSLEVAPGRVKAQRHAGRGLRQVTCEDVASLAHHFGVSYQAAAFRLRDLGMISRKELDSLREREELGRAYLRLLNMLDDLEGKDEVTQSDRELVSQVVHLALEAYRRGEISRGKLRDLSSLLNLSAEELLGLADAVQTDD